MPAHLQVWGDPIAHSRSPQLHAAAYAALGLDWTYDRRQVDEASFVTALAGLDESYRGLSLTMPLKGVAHAAARTRDRRAALTGAVNTLLLSADGPHGFNTDVGGIVRDLGEQGVSAVSEARIVGAGATATSALVALGELGAEGVLVSARRPEAAEPLVGLGERLGMRVRVEPLGTPSAGELELTVSTLPGGAAIAPQDADALAASGGLLYDVVYGHWPTALAEAWERAGGRAVAGSGMLLQQALLQVRIFVQGDAETALPGEDDVLQAMRDAADAARMGD
ncbi:shikimate dehydrogenase [Microbacterium mangrovi]|uniref:Shikimate dehydrogenase n=1 Tax=Microbacterium mangrovi TaxID=1348253 RepID=A0A0B2ABL0_9MICO|nr:shikimate dehydrogenase [Microbacterium mangrovi]KHK98982.1 shikimate dehydrogenase [Microbacterium mangrovi]